jgi:hypothetical protein
LSRSAAPPARGTAPATPRGRRTDGVGVVGLGVALAAGPRDVRRQRDPAQPGPGGSEDRALSRPGARWREPGHRAEAPAHQPPNCRKYPPLVKGSASVASASLGAHSRPGPWERATCTKKEREKFMRCVETFGNLRPMASNVWQVAPILCLGAHFPQLIARCRVRAFSQRMSLCICITNKYASLVPGAPGVEHLLRWPAGGLGREPPPPRRREEEAGRVHPGAAAGVAVHGVVRQAVWVPAAGHVGRGLRFGSAESDGRFARGD